MLGLGQNLSSPSFSGEKTFSYFKETIESSDGWSDSSVNGSANIEYNQPAPDLSTGWLKVTFDSDQTDFWAIQNTSIVNNSPNGLVAGATVTIKHDVYLHNAALWGDDGDDDDDNILWASFIGGDPESFSVTPGSATSSTTNHTSTNTSNTIQFRNGVTTSTRDLPLANAVFYIKNIEVKITYP